MAKSQESNAPAKAQETQTTQVANPNTKMSNLGVKDLFSQPMIKAKFSELLGKRASQFMTSVLQIVASNDMLKNADAVTIFNASLMSATLDLPINNNLGFAYIVPFNNRQKDGNFKVEASFQIGYKGFKQLAIRSGQYLSLDSKPVYEGQKIQDNTFLGYHFDWSAKTSDKIVGYASNFVLHNGFESTFYMDFVDVEAHARKYSQSYKKGYGFWADGFDKMALKTVTKLHLNSGEAPLSIEMQKAIESDLSIVREDGAITYPDNEHKLPSIAEVSADKEKARVIEHINSLTTIEQLQAFRDTAKANGCETELNDKILSI